jgi:predicted nucleotidyltransferase
MEAHRIEEELRRFFMDGRHGVVAAYVFGSVARGEANEASDIGTIRARL